jgi:sigma-B regulation protein RsbU (phosphoserine phosphatase)
LNRLISADHDGERFMTMHLSVIDARSGSARWVSAGHDPALVYDPAAGSFEEVGEGGLPLGVVHETEYREQSFGPLRPGQVIFVGTDGVWEMPNAAGKPFGKDRLREAIREAAPGSAEEIADTIRERLAHFRGNAKQVDDVTFVVVKLPPAGTR